MSKIAEQKALKAYPILFSERNGYDSTFKDRIESYTKGYDQALCDIKQRIKEIIEHQEKEWGKSNVDIGLYTILGHIVETEEDL